MSKSIFELVDQLPTNNMTTLTLRSLDFIVPGQWENVVGFTNTIRHVTGETDESYIQQIGERAIQLYNDKSQGYQNAMWLYQTVDRTDQALGAAALANKVGGNIPLIGGFLTRVTPKANKAQTIDLSLKLVVELIAFCQVNGIPGDSIGDFLAALRAYSSEALMRMVALVCIDGLIPLGPDFIQMALSNLSQTTPSDLESNQSFSSIRSMIPGGNTIGQLNFITHSFDSVKGWMSDLVMSRGLTPEKVVSNMQRFVEISNDKLDYLGAFLDMTTNYYEHTGTQSLARRLIERAAAEI